MLSTAHEGIAQLFRNRPELAAELLRDALRVAMPPYTEARVDAADLTTVTPVEYRADLVVLLLHGKPVMAIIVEVQLGRDRNKRYTWPAYLTNLRARMKCPARLLVIAPDRSIGRWCGQPIETGHPGFALTPLVAGPDAVPVIEDVALARQVPELAVLSIVAHGQTEHGLAIGRAVLKAADGLDEERKALYADLSYLSMNEAARRALEELMKSGYEFQSDFARTYFGKGREEGRQEGRKEGLQKGLQEGLQEGLQKGLQKGRAEAVIKFLEARGLRVSKSVRERILACSDIAELDRWIVRAAVVKKASDLFKPEPS